MCCAFPVHDPSPADLNTMFFNSTRCPSHWAWSEGHIARRQRPCQTNNTGTYSPVVPPFEQSGKGTIGREFYGVFGTFPQIEQRVAF